MHSMAWRVWGNNQPYVKFMVVKGCLNSTVYGHVLTLATLSYIP